MTNSQALWSLRRAVLDDYDPKDFPALFDQLDRWTTELPLAGVSVLDATPLFSNTLTKYLPLLAGGAELTVATHPEIPHDPEVVDLLRRMGFDHHSPSSNVMYDIVFDCAGRHADVTSRMGYVELTRSGADRYWNCTSPVILVDDSRIKLLETMFGTGSGFVRALEQLGFADLAGREVLVFGGGKVGQGVTHACRQRGAEVAIVDYTARGAGAVEPAPPDAIRTIDASDAAAVRASIRSAWCIVTATGISDAVARYARDLNDSGALLANMGVEDEFGATIDPQRVLNRKAPLNFVLAEPTPLRFIEPTFALSNAAGLQLLTERLSPGIHPPSDHGQDLIVAALRKSGRLAQELALLGLTTPS
jgi:adenosylhomocysteinase